MGHRRTGSPLRGSLLVHTAATAGNCDTWTLRKCKDRESYMPVEHPPQPPSLNGPVLFDCAAQQPARPLTRYAYRAGRARGQAHRATKTTLTVLSWHVGRAFFLIRLCISESYPARHPFATRQIRARATSRSIPPKWGPIRLRPRICTYDAPQCGPSVRVDELAKSRTTPT